jgi:CRISPR-associated RAMP protein (TIGR02581 family)
MLRRLYARCDLDIEMAACSALLVQGAQAQEGAATFYRAHDPADNSREKYCIPATTLKGVWRSAAESILRSFEPWLACDPFEEDKENKGKVSKSCSKRLENDPRANTPLAYAAACPACRLFGSTTHAGLLQTRDAWAVKGPQHQAKVGIAIDRFAGSVKDGALYTYNALPAGTHFVTSLTLHNPELWQVGLLALAFREMTEGRVRLGTGARRGLGHVAVTAKKAVFRYPSVLYNRKASAQSGCICSAQALALDGDRLEHVPPDPWLLPGLKQQVAPDEDWAAKDWTCFLLEDEDVRRLFIACVDDALAPRLRMGRRGFYAPGSPETHDEVEHG